MADEDWVRGRVEEARRAHPVSEAVLERSRTLLAKPAALTSGVLDDLALKFIRDALPPEKPSA